MTSGLSENSTALHSEKEMGNPWGFLSGRSSRALLVLCDLVIILAACIGFSYWRIGQEDSSIFQPGGFASTLVLVGSLLISVALVGGYRPPQPLRRLSMAAEFILACGIGLVTALFVIYVVFYGTDIQTQSRMVFVFATAAFTPTALTLRWLLDHALNKQSSQRPLLFLGSATGCEQFEDFGAKIGVYNPVHKFAVELDGVQKFYELLENQKLKGYEAIILENDLSIFSKELLERLMRVHFNELPVLRMRAYFAVMRRQIPVLDIDAAWIFERDFSLADRSPYRFVKRIFDVVFATVLSVLLIPVVVFVAAGVKIADRGPVFFCQKRMGRNGRVFKIYKFRTMLPGSELGGAYTQPGDVRVTRIGRVLRRLRLDEIPQLFNVLKGDMSLIGPRPEWVRLVDVYEQKIPYYHLRHLVKPGLTGWAQLNYRYGESLEDAKEKLRYDLYYIEYYSPSLDLEILLKTLLHVLFLKGR